MRKVKKFALSLPVQLLITIFIALLIGDEVDIGVVSFFFSVSELIKSFILAVLPFMLFAFISSALSSLNKDKGLKIIAIIFFGTLVLNFSSIMLAYFASYFISGSKGNIEALNTISNVIYVFDFSIPILIPNTAGLGAGFITGLIASYKQNTKLINFTKKSAEASLKFFKTCFTPIIPLFVFGYILKMVFEKNMIDVLQGNALVILYILLIIFICITMLLAYAADFKISTMKEYTVNIIPAMVTGFSTFSSAAALPLSIKATYHNTKDEVAADVFIPATANAHMISDNISLPIIAIMLMQSFGLPAFSFENYLIFALHAAFYRFAVSPVPAGSSIILMPLMENFLGATGQVTAIMTIFYILFENFGTAGNVAANNALAIIFSKKISNKT